MSIKKRTILTILAATAIIITFEIIHAHTVFLDNYKELERTEILKDANHIQSAMDYELSKLTSLTHDWAAWDDTYQFVQDSNDAYIKSNLVDSTFETLGVNLIVFFDRDQNIVYKKAYDLASQEAIPVPDEISLFLDESNKLFEIDEDESICGYLSENYQPMMYCTAPISTSNDEGPSQGALLFAMPFQEKLLNFMENTVDSTLTIRPYEESAIPDDCEVAYLDETNSTEIYIHNDSPSIVSYYSLIRDYQGRPIFIIHQKLDRVIYRQGLRSMKNQILMILLTSLIAGLLTIYILNKYFLSRLSTLHDAVIDYRVEQKREKSICLSGNDELAHLSNEMDQTLRSLLQTQSRLNGFLEYEKLMVDISSKFINLPINKISKGLQNVLMTIGEYIQADMGHIFIFEEGNVSSIENVYRWQKPGTKPIKEDIQISGIRSMQWASNKIANGESITLANLDDLPKKAKEEKAFLEEKGIISIISVPLMVGGELIGIISFEWLRENKNWNEQTPLLLEIISTIITNAIDRKQNEEQLQSSRKFQYQLNQITKTSIEKDNFNSSIRALSKQLRLLISTDRCWLVLLEKNKALQIYNSGKKLKISKETFAIIQNLMQMTKSGIYIYNSDNHSPPGEPSDFDQVGKSFIAIPLSAKNQHQGLVILANDKNHKFTVMEKDICQQTAKQITLAIIKIRALEESRQISRELRDLRTAVVDFSSELELKKLLDTILSRAVKLLKAEGGEFYIYHEDTRELETVTSINLGKEYRGTRIKSGQGAAGKAIELGKIYTLKDYSTWHNRLSMYDDVKIKASMTAPLTAGNKLLGCVAIFHFDPDITFSKNDQNLFTIFAQHASIAIHNAMLFERVQKMARIDEVTSLLNRRALNEIGAYEIKRAKRLERPIAVAMIDLDNYKQINDTCNHLVGDKVLKEIGRLFRENVRNIDILGRYGGDECVVIMPETDLEHSIQTVERIRSILESTEIKVGENRFHITACIGVSAYERNPPSLEQMIEEADTAMYLAKEQGRNCVKVFTK